jgi:hypothetical protein
MITVVVLDLSKTLRYVNRDFPNKMQMPGVVDHSYNTSTQEDEAEGFMSLRNLKIYSEFLSAGNI